MKMNPSNANHLRRGLVAGAMAGSIALTGTACSDGGNEAAMESHALPGHVTKSLINGSVTFRQSPHVLNPPSASNICAVTTKSFQIDAQAVPVRMDDPDSDWIGLPSNLPVFKKTQCADDATHTVWFSVSQADGLRANLIGDYSIDPPAPIVKN